MTETPPSRRALEQRAWVRRTVRSGAAALIMLSVVILSRALHHRSGDGDLGRHAVVMALIIGFTLLVAAVLTHPSSGWAGYRIYDGLPGHDRRTIRQALRETRPLERPELLATAAWEQAEALAKQGRQAVFYAVLLIALFLVDCWMSEGLERWFFVCCVPGAVGAAAWSVAQGRRARAYLAAVPHPGTERARHTDEEAP